MHRVLIVEDNDDLRALYRRALSGEGYEIVLAINGQEALEFLRSTSSLPKLILLDLMMPVMDGWEFLSHKIQEPHLADIPVVVCSASKGSIPDTERYLRKPIDLNVLLEVVSKYCSA